MIYEHIWTSRDRPYGGEKNKDFKQHVSDPGTFISLEWKEFASLDRKLQAAIVHSFK